MTDAPRRLADGPPMIVHPAPTGLDVFNPAAWQPLGTISGTGTFTPDEYTDTGFLGTDPDSPWALPVRHIGIPHHQTTSVEFTITDVNRDLVSAIFHIPLVWLLRPKMKRRAARRIAGFTRTGRRR